MRNKGFSTVEKHKHLRRFIILLVVLAVIVLIGNIFMQHPGIKNKEKKTALDKMSDFQYVAHRGYFSADPIENKAENTLPAFEAAILKGYAFELDVHLTKDKQLAVIHDSRLGENAIKIAEDAFLNEHQTALKTRLNNHIKTMTMAEINEVTDEFGLYGTSLHIPTLQEVCDMVKLKIPENKKAMVVIEIKADQNDSQKYIAELCSEVNKVITKNQSNDFIMVVQSFHPMVLRWFKNNAPKVVRGFLAIDYTGKLEGTVVKVGAYLLKNMYTNFLSRPDFIAYSYNRDKDEPHGYFLYHKVYNPYRLAWTIRDSEDVEAPFEKGYNGIIFDTVKNPEKYRNKSGE